MDEKETQIFHDILAQIAREDVPEDYHAWPIIENKFGQMSRSFRSGPLFLKKQQDGFHFGKPLTALIALAFLAVLLFWLTPPGRAFAGQVFTFFQNAFSDHRPAQSDDFEPLALTRTPRPAIEAGIKEFDPTRDGPQAFFTPTAQPRVAAGSVFFGISLADAQNLVDYQVRIPADLPAGYQFVLASVDQTTRAVSQTYKFFPVEAGELFTITQTPLENAATEPVGQSASIEQFTLGDDLVEYVEGSWLHKYGDTQEEWQNAGPPYRFAWKDTAFRYDIGLFVDDVFRGGYLSRADMLDFIEVFFGIKPSLNSTVKLNYLTDLSIAETYTGWKILFPKTIPAGMFFSHAIYEPENDRVVLLFRLQDISLATSGVGMNVIEIHAGSGDSTPTCEDQPTVQLDGRMACLSTDEQGNLSLTWKAGLITINLQIFSTNSATLKMDVEDLILIANSLN